jgi:hypothetical protein
LLLLWPLDIRLKAALDALHKLVLIELPIVIGIDFHSHASFLTCICLLSSISGKKVRQAGVEPPDVRKKTTSFVSPCMVFTQLSEWG